MSYSETLYNAQQGHKVISDVWPKMKAALMAGHRLVLTIKREQRSSEQNRKMWACLQDIANQVTWHGIKLDPEDWKHVFTASMKRQRLVPGIDGHMVVLGQSTSRMTKEELSELIELIMHFGSEQEVVWSKSDDYK